MVEVSIAPKSQKLSAADHAQLTDLLLAKDAELKKTLELADEQAKIQQKMNELKAEVDNKVQLIFRYALLCFAIYFCFVSFVKVDSFRTKTFIIYKGN